MLPCWCMHDNRLLLYSFSLTLTNMHTHNLYIIIQIHKTAGHMCHVISFFLCILSISVQIPNTLTFLYYYQYMMIVWYFHNPPNSDKMKTGMDYRLCNVYITTVIKCNKHRGFWFINKLILLQFHLKDLYFVVCTEFEQRNLRGGAKPGV